MFATCQYIPGDAPFGSDDCCKCGKPVWRGTAWCRTHYKRVYQRREAAQKPQDGHNPVEGREAA
ncbi:hypothetical protein [Ferruginivarius sediminum]|uniref:hypothetical protein n=1 Tax=Ferruginivarius sediminum TaxID=2661937 RepID=UPI0011C03F52|nr:hypothetical protein [Ferruginivarius sediminum]